MIISQRIIDEVKIWLGTPFHPNARQKNAGCDCFGLILGVYEQLGGQVPPLPIYACNRQSLQQQQEALLAALDHIAVRGSSRQPGDILLFGIAETYLHCGILVSERMFIHSQEGQFVQEARFSERWQRRLLAIYNYKFNFLGI